MTCLFLKVTNGIVVGVGQEMSNLRRGLFNVRLELIHEVTTIALQFGLIAKQMRLGRSYLDLIHASNRTEHDFCKTAMLEWSISNPSNDLETSFHKGDTDRILVENEPRDILSRHFRKLLLKKHF